MSDGLVALMSMTVGADEDTAEATAREAATALLAAAEAVVDADRLGRPGGEIDATGGRRADVRDGRDGGSLRWQPEAAWGRQ